MAKGWLEISPGWLGALFGLQTTGNARVDMLTGKFQIEVEDPKIGEEGEVLEGVGHAVVGRVFIPTGWRPLGRKRATA